MLASLSATAGGTWASRTTQNHRKRTKQFDKTLIDLAPGVDTALTRVYTY